MCETGEASDCSNSCSISPIQVKHYQREVADPIERRKRQNRERQRAWRQRKIAARETTAKRFLDDTPWEGYGLLMPTDRSEGEVLDHSVTFAAWNRYQGATHTDSQLPIRRGNHAAQRNSQKLIPPLLPYGRSDAPLRPSFPMSFPLSADHCLITLVQYNVVRAMLFNMSILSMMDHIPLGCGHSLRIPCFGAIAPEKIPPDLQPTRLQESTPHLFWIDAIPFPKLRDNLILMSGRYDSSDFLYDIGMGLYEGFNDAERRGYLVWGHSWSASGWEVSEGFAMKWGYLLSGCTDIIESTNRWRDIRGEDRLVVEI